MTDEVLTPEEEAEIALLAREAATAIIDAMFVRAGLLAEPTTEMGREAYAKAIKAGK